MIPLPRWAMSVLIDRCCPYCGATRNPAYVTGVGVRDISNEFSKTVQKGNIALAFEYNCNFCNTTYQVTVDPKDTQVSAEDILNDILMAVEIYLGRKVKTTTPKMSKTGITNKEIRDLKRILSESKTWNDFLNNIGISNDFIDKVSEEYKEEKGNKNGNHTEDK